MKLDRLNGMKRTDYCGTLRLSDKGKRVVVCGWVQRQRDLGSLIFVDLRDYTGVTQVVIHNEEFLKNVNRETVISVTGVVEERDPDTVNEKDVMNRINSVYQKIQKLK